MACLWSDDVSALSPREFSDIAAENRAWGKSLREETRALVQARLEKTITREEYLAGRARANADSVECNRRRDLLARRQTSLSLPL